MLKYGIIEFWDGRIIKFQWFSDLDTLYSASARAMTGDKRYSIAFPPDNDFYPKYGTKELAEVSKSMYERTQGINNVGKD